MTEANSESFCWMKAVLCDPPPVPDVAMPAGQAVVALPTLEPPPAPALVLDGGMSTMGKKVPPPSPAEMPRVPPPPPGGGGVVAQQAALEPSKGGSWQVVSCAPGRERAPGEPVVLLVFQPVPGGREEAVLWREANPIWFADAAAASLVNCIV
ncbi:hypothetical protein [Pelomonas cellulosilytica]|uniref:Uncharacterized protein n=1 Tax=Pelomonas cellulosilytica TaxID=2906762 RepID=A0ABS8XUT8_9BURK|nr:hypothetical protein [Pelomonas sp. P8]MCE4556459.1 hypothetical protein [Pelomonas sp. P8]